MITFIRVRFEISDIKSAKNITTETGKKINIKAKNIDKNICLILVTLFLLIKRKESVQKISTKLGKIVNRNINETDIIDDHNVLDKFFEIIISENIKI